MAQSLLRVLHAEAAGSLRLSMTGRNVGSTMQCRMGRVAYSTGDGRKITLPFNEYRKWNKSLKIYGRMAGLPLGLVLGWLGSMAWIYNYPYMFAPDQDPEFDPNNPKLIMGSVDPIVAMAITNVGLLSLGFGLGGTVYRNLWGVFNRPLAAQIKLRNADFQQRLDSHRVLSVQRQGEDFYGEKIMSLTDYLHWLRVQRQKLKPVHLQEFTVMKK